MPFLTTANQISLNQLLFYLNLYQHAKNQFVSFIHFWDTANLRVPWPDWPHPFLTILSQKIFDRLLICLNLYQHELNKLIASVHSWDTVNSADTILTTPTFDHAQPKYFWSTFNFCEFVPTCKKNDAIVLICSGEIVDFKMMQSDWFGSFLPISLEQDFSQYRIWIGFGEKLNSTFFKISLNSKNRIFGKFLAHFPNFWSKKRFFQKFQLCHAQLHKSVYYHAKIQGNQIIQFQENSQTDCRTEGRTDPISYDPSGYRRGSNINHCSRLAFKSQRQSTMLV